MIVRGITFLELESINFCFFKASLISTLCEFEYMFYSFITMLLFKHLDELSLFFFIWVNVNDKS